MSVYRVVLVGVAVCGLSWPVLGQSSAPFETPPPGSGPTPMEPYGEAAGCSEAPALFHPCALEKAETFDPPRTPDGTPDFQGMWNRFGIRNMENIQEHPETMDGNGGLSSIVDPPNGLIPFQPWAKAKRDAHFDTYLDPPRMCLPQGAPRFAYGGAKRWVQQPGLVAMFNSQAGWYRLVLTDERPHLGEKIRLFEGDARGRWEGNTLVIDINNQNAIAWLDHVGDFYSDAVHVEERMTMIDPDVIHYTATITDPNVYTQPWTMAWGLRRQANSDGEIWESACWEGVSGGPSLVDTELEWYPGVVGEQR